MNSPTESSPTPRPAALRLFGMVLISIGALATLVAAFYTEENWRGKRAWENYRHELESQGAVFDWSTRIPPTVPDDQNFFKAPKMAEWFAGRGTNNLSVRLDNPKTHTIGTGTNAIQTEADARDYLAWSDQFVPDFDQIRAALKRPYARIECDYGQPTTILAPNFQTIRNLAQTLGQRSRSFLLLGQPEKALPELTLLHDFCRILDCPPTGKPITLVGAMINVAVAGLYAEAVHQGLQSHAWREEQLAALQKQLGEIHLETDVAETFIDEPMFTLRTLETTSRPELVKILYGFPDNAKKWLLLPNYAPRGWLFRYMIVHEGLNQSFLVGFDSANQTVSPRKIDDAGRILQDNIAHSSAYNFLASLVTPNWGKALQRLAANQTMANEGALACAIERYHLAHGDYPEKLDALVPRLIDKLPHDVIGGQPLKYKRIDAGQFLLYSVGWNETDDGGVPGSTIAEGDLVWGQSFRTVMR